MSSTSTSGSIAKSPRSRSRVVVFAGLSALFIGAALWRPSDSGIPLCTIKMAAGFSCPGCGMTRALAALGRGEPAASFKYHAFAPVVALGAALAWIAIAIGFVTGRDLLPNLNDKRAVYILLGFIVAFVAYWLVRLASGTAP
ncbi:MAG TPA: DUF2752 domain-containing protein [Planctomycetota bacterium]|nr:DUF2752 domain-containing protein [Planctomycetota bacterium]